MYHQPYTSITRASSKGLTPSINTIHMVLGVVLASFSHCLATLDEPFPSGATGNK